MTFELFVDYTSDYEIKTGKKYKTIPFTATSEFEAVKTAYKMLTDIFDDAPLWAARQNIYCVNVSHILRDGKKFLIRYRYGWVDDKVYITPDFHE